MAMRSVNHWARCLVLGLVDKCFRVLTVPHFAAALFNPGFSRIPDLNDHLPWDKQWFTDGLREVDYRTTNECVKNHHNAYRPTWLPNGSTVRDEVVKFVAKRIEIAEEQMLLQTIAHTIAQTIAQTMSLGPTLIPGEATKRESNGGRQHSTGTGTSRNCEV